MRHRFGYLFLLPVLLFLGACHSTPDHAQYIPQNALMVAEVNTKELSKKIAWSMITGSSLLDKLRGHSKDSAKQSDFIRNMSEAGVDELNTFYVYAKSNGDKTPCFVALIPLKDARKWETFLKKTFDATVKEAGKRKEAKLTDDIYAGWTNNLLIVVSVQEDQLPYAGGEAEDITPELLLARTKTDKEPLLMSQLESAFNVTKESSLLEDKRFSAFENNRHDFGFWVNLEAVMNNYGSRNIASLTGGFSPSSSMWKNSAFSAATNFEKGRVVTDLLVYSPEEVKEINEEFAKNNIDNDIVDRVPAEGLDYLMAYRLAPAGIGKMLQKMGVNGLAEGLLKEYNLSLNEVLGSITGDLVFSMNNFSQQQETVLFDSTDATSAITNYKMDMDMLFALKLSNKASFMKLINLGQTMEMLKQKGPDTYALATGGIDSSVIVVSDKYAVFSNKERVARAYINNNNRKSTMMAKDHIYKHPFGMFFDYQAWSKGMSMMTGNKADSIVFAASRRTFDNYVFNGGTFSNNTIKYQMSINFVDKKENSLLQLLDFAKSMQEADALRQAELESLEADMAGEADSVLQ